MYKPSVVNYIALILMLTYGCNQKAESNSVEQRIVYRITKLCKPGENCIIHIKDITDFSWDKMYVFGDSATLDEIEKTLGTPLSHWEEITRTIAFLKDGQIAYYENDPIGIEAPRDGEIIFYPPNSDGVSPRDKVYNLYTPDDATFMIEKKEIKNGAYYILRQIR